MVGLNRRQNQLAMEEGEQVQTRPYMFSERLERTFALRYRFKNPKRRGMGGSFRGLAIQETRIQAGKSLHVFLRAPLSGELLRDG